MWTISINNDNLYYYDRYLCYLCGNKILNAVWISPATVRTRRCGGCMGAGIEARVYKRWCRVGVALGRQRGQVHRSSVIRVPGVFGRTNAPGPDLREYHTCGPPRPELCANLQTASQFMGAAPHSASGCFALRYFVSSAFVMCVKPRRGS